MVNKVLLGFGTLSLALATAATSHMVRIFNPVIVNGSTLRPGEYRVSVNQDTATLKSGKTEVKAPVMVEKSNHKFSTTSMRMNGKDLQEIQFGGTHTRLLFENSGKG